MTGTIGLIVGAALLAFVVSWLSLFPVRRFAQSLGLLDRPGGHKRHTAPTPLGGGLGIYLGVLATVGGATIGVAVLRNAGLCDTIESRWSGAGSIDADWSGSMWQTAREIAPGVATRLVDAWWLMGGCTVLLVLGLLDDRYGLSVRWRLGVQFAVATAAVLGLQVELTAFIDAPWLTRTLSVIWIVAVINSFNMLDNMDALSGGIAAIIAVSMAVVMLTTPDPGSGRPQYLVAALLVVVAGAILGFLIHNRPPARIFMGDGGSYLVGFLISVSMLLATYASPTVDDVSGWRPHAILAPLCAMAVPLYDLTTVLWIRFSEGRSPFLGDHSHLSHRLVALGLSRAGAVSTVHLLTLTCGLSAILIAHVPPWQAIMVLGIVACVLLLMMILESTHWRGHDR